MEFDVVMVGSYICEYISGSSGNEDFLAVDKFKSPK